MVAVGRLYEPTATRVAACGVLLCAVAYLTAVRDGRNEDWRRALFWIGSVALLPASLFLAFAASRGWWHNELAPSLMSALYVTGWLVAVIGPLALAMLLRGMDAWANAAASVWAIVLIVLASAGSDIALYLWWALGAVGLVAWGVHDGRGERVNFGAAIFAATVIAFYFSQVMDKLGRSASLVGLGLLFLAGGWALERVRRRLVVQARGAA